MTSLSLLDEITVAAGEGRPIPDAATRETIGFVPVHTRERLEPLIAAAQKRQRDWAEYGHDARSATLHEIADDIEANAEQLAHILSREQGKPLNGPNARFEVGACVAWIRNAADTPLDREVIVDRDGLRAEVHHEALGVVAAIGPWNWPMMITVWQIAPALRMGNAVIVKPSSYTPLSVLALVQIFNRHLPDGLLSVIVGDRHVGSALAAHPAIAKVMFTGSTAAGRQIVSSSADNLARLTLELGGNDAGIVLEGTDVDAVADDLFWGCFINTGQTCAALKRLYVHDSLYDEVVNALAERARSVPMGHGLSEHALLGPLQNQAQFDLVKALVDEAKIGGARIVAGGEPAEELGPLFFRTTVIAHVADGARIVDEEQFGPVIPVIRYSSVSDAVRRANASPQGLGASVWSSDVEAALDVAGRLNAGTVWINQHGTLDPSVPFGGAKQSGYGQEFGVEGLKAVSLPKVVTWRRQA